MLLALWSMHYPFNGGELPQNNRWFAYGVNEDKAKILDSIVDEIVVESQRNANVIQNIDVVIPQKIQVKAELIDEITSPIILEAIRLAKIEYYTYLANMRRKDEETAIMLLLN